jgi:hypothetical protein
VVSAGSARAPNDTNRRCIHGAPDRSDRYSIPDPPSRRLTKLRGHRLALDRVVTRELKLAHLPLRQSRRRRRRHGDGLSLSRALSDDWSWIESVGAVDSNSTWMHACSLDEMRCGVLVDIPDGGVGPKGFWKRGRGGWRWSPRDESPRRIERYMRVWLWRGRGVAGGWIRVRWYWRVESTKKAEGRWDVWRNAYRMHAGSV